MNLRGKLLLATLLPLLASFALTAWVLREQQTELAGRQRQLVRDSYLAASQSELRHYVALALSTISPLYNTGRDDEEIRREAMKRLAQLDYGPDGYFFLYDFDGTNLMHPRQPELMGHNLIGLRDGRGQPVILQMIEKAKAGGGFVDYTWNKPSTRAEASKLAYVTGLERWHWMLGTGIYTDDLDRVMLQLDQQLASNVATTMRFIAIGTAGSIVLALVIVLGIGWNELRAADAKLTLLTRQVVHSQERERAWLSRELHDGTSQTLVSAKLLIESSLERLPPEEQWQRPTLLRALDRVNRALADVRGMSHQLRPAELDQLGLATALHQLGQEMSQDAGLAFSLAGGEHLDALPEEIRTTLFRVAQEALTNAVKHAGATSIAIALEGDADAGGVRLVVEDNGRGFDSQAVAQHPKRGIGLRNMRERLVAIGGALTIDSRPQRTAVIAEVPASAVRRLARRPKSAQAA